MFDNTPTTDWISSDARRYDAVWGTVHPSLWDAAHPGMIVSDYFILGLDRQAVSGHSLAWFQANHPDWLLYACDASGTPTHDLATMSGVPDGIPLDIANPAVLDYQVRQVMVSNALANGYNALALDQVVFQDFYGVRGEWGCGVWNGDTFVRRYSAPSDPQFASNVLGFVRAARTIANSVNLAFGVNHPAGPIKFSNEQQILANVDFAVDEVGFSDYGQYALHPNGFNITLNYLLYAQRHGVAVATLNRFHTSMSPAQLEYVFAGYLLANVGGELLFAGVDQRYHGEEYHPEYAAPIGTPCAGVSGGPVYVRRFSNAFVVVNATSANVSVPLPAGSFRDLEGRALSNPLVVGPSDGYVLLGPGGC